MGPLPSLESVQALLQPTACLLSSTSPRLGLPAPSSGDMGTPQETFSPLSVPLPLGPTVVSSKSHYPKVSHGFRPVLLGPTSWVVEYPSVCHQKLESSPLLQLVVFL